MEDAYEEIRGATTHAQDGLLKGLEKAAEICRLVVERDASSGANRERFKAVAGMGFGDAQIWLGRFAAAIAALSGERR